jgi:hypothetical protein
MSARHTLDMTLKPSGDLYELLIEALAPLAALVGMVIRSDKVQLGPQAQDLMRDLTPYLVHVDELSTWPGTVLLGEHRSKVYQYRLVPEVVTLILSSASSLYQWVNPDLPEDLHFLRADGSTVLGSVAQEEDSWIELEDLEFANWSVHAPLQLRQALHERPSD